MREVPSRQQIIDEAQALGAVPYSPAPMRAIKGVSFTFDQLDKFVARMINPNTVILDHSEGTRSLRPKEVIAEPK